jgi:hypothetical protein
MKIRSKMNGTILACLFIVAMSNNLKFQQKPSCWKPIQMSAPGLKNVRKISTGKEKILDVLAARENADV